MYMSWFLAMEVKIVVQNRFRIHWWPTLLKCTMDHPCDFTLLTVAIEFTPQFISWGLSQIACAWTTTHPQCEVFLWAFQTDHLSSRQTAQTRWGLGRQKPTIIYIWCYMSPCRAPSKCRTSDCFGPDASQTLKGFRFTFLKMYHQKF